MLLVAGISFAVPASDVVAGCLLHRPVHSYGAYIYHTSIDAMHQCAYRALGASSRISNKRTASSEWFRCVLSKPRAVFQSVACGGCLLYVTPVKQTFLEQVCCLLTCSFALSRIKRLDQDTIGTWYSISHQGATTTVRCEDMGLVAHGSSWYDPDRTQTLLTLLYVRVSLFYALFSFFLLWNFYLFFTSLHLLLIRFS